MFLEFNHIPQLIVGVYILYLGLFVFTKNPRSATHRSFLWIAAATAFWLVPYMLAYKASDPVAYQILRFSYSFIIFIPAALYHFCALIVQEKTEDKYVKLSYLSVFPFLILLWTSDLIIQKELYHYVWGNYPKAGQWHPFFLLFFVITQLRVNYLLIMKFVRFSKADDKEGRDKIFLLLVGSFIFNLASFDFLPNYGIDIHPAGFIFAGVFASCMTVAIMTQQLLDFKKMVKRTAVYSVVAFLLSCSYVVFIFLVTAAILRSSYSYEFLVANLLVISLVVLFLKPFEMFLNRRLDKRFFKGTIFEISEQKEKLESDLERSERLKTVGILAAGMAHEIKNPITAIQTFANYLPERYEDPEFREKFQRIVTQETSRIRDIVTNLLLFSKPQEPHPRPTDLSIILKDTLELLNAEFLSHKIKISHNLNNPLPKVLADPEQMKQVFLNIILNAIDAMKESGGELKVLATVTPKELEIHIKDTGPGILSEKLPYIFDPFFTDKESGTGLGLAIAHSIMEKHKGKIVATSEFPQGASFKVSLLI